MQFTLLFSTATLLLTASASGLPPDHPEVKWQPAGPGDIRAPCPMLNALANHGYLPHDGKNISQDELVTSLMSALNFDQKTAEGQFKQALASNPEKGAKTFSLDNLGRHKVVEHDASLSRQDYYFSKDEHSFNPEVFAETLAAWGFEWIDVESAARARHARITTSKATNPTFSTDALDSGYGESAVLIATIGDKTTAKAKKAWVEYLFQHERLPSELGWEKPKETIGLADIGAIQKQIEKKMKELDEPMFNLVINKRDTHAHRVRGHAH